MRAVISGPFANRIRSLLLIALATQGCIPVRHTRTSRDVVLERGTRVVHESATVTREIEVVRTTARGVDLRVTDSSECPVYATERFEMRTAVARETNGFLHVGSYVLAAAAAGLGAAVLVDAPNVADGTGREVNPVGRDGAYAIGISLSAASLVPLIYGIATSVSDQDVEEISNTSTRDVGIAGHESCGRAPAADVDAYVVEGDSGRIERTDAEGRVSIDLFDALGPLALGRRASVTVRSGTAQVPVDTLAFRGLAGEAAWVATDRGDITSLTAFVEAFPRGAHATEANALIRDLRITAAAEATRRAITAGRELEAARALELLRQLDPAHPDLAGLGDTISGLAEQRRVREQQDEAAAAEAAIAWFDDLAGGPFHTGMSRAEAQRTCQRIGSRWDGSSATLASCSDAPVHVLGVMTSIGWSVGLRIRRGRVRAIVLMQMVHRPERLAADLRHRIENAIGAGRDRAELRQGTAPGWYWMPGGPRMLELNYSSRLGMVMLRIDPENAQD